MIGCSFAPAEGLMANIAIQTDVRRGPCESFGERSWSYDTSSHGEPPMQAFWDGVPLSGVAGGIDHGEISFE